MTPLPPNMTMQLPHSPTSQACFAPIKSRLFLRTSNRVLSGDASTVWVAPLTLREMGVVVGMSQIPLLAYTSLEWAASVGVKGWIVPCVEYCFTAKVMRFDIGSDGDVY